MTKLAEVHTLYESNCRQIPEMLRQAADSIETEEAEGFSRTVAMGAVQITENGDVQIYGWGETDAYKMLGMLERGKLALLKMLEGE